MDEPSECAGGMALTLGEGDCHGFCPTCDELVVLISDGSTLRHWPRKESTDGR